MFKVYFLTSVADVVASVTLNLKFQFFVFKNENKGVNSKK
jgi:hypothetical protein